jgi:hypothetical protein
MDSYSKAQLLEMNSSTTLGFNWIKNIESIKKDEKAKIYPTGDAGLASGRIYVALPESTILTKYIITQFNLWI